MEELEKESHSIPVFGDFYSPMRMEENFINLNLSLDSETILLNKPISRNGTRFKKPGRGMDSIFARERECVGYEDEIDGQELKNDFSNLTVKQINEMFPRCMIFGRELVLHRVVS